MAYTPVLEAGAEKHTGSSPVTGTRITESWLSGLKQQVANLSWCHSHHWFDSNTLRHLGDDPNGEEARWKRVALHGVAGSSPVVSANIGDHPNW